MSDRVFHAVTCTPAVCDPPRTAWEASTRRGKTVRAIPHHLPGCAIGDPRIPGGLSELSVRHWRHVLAAVPDAS